MNATLQSILFVFIYGALLFGLIKLFGVKYTEITKSIQHVKKGILYPVGIATLLLIAWGVYTGRLAPAFTSPYDVVQPWLWALPVLLLVGMAARLKQADWHKYGLKGVGVLMLAVFAVGLSEELVFRGLLTHYVQASGFGLFAAAVFTSLLFGIVHGMNYFNGQSARTTLTQIVFTAITGLGFFATYVVSGTLWLPIALHALFDFSLLIQGGVINESKRTLSPVEIITNLLFYVGSLVSAVVFLIAS